MIVGTSGIGFMMFDARRAGSVVEILVGMIILGLLWYIVDAWILAPLERRMARPLDILDLGSGNCWLSYRLSLRQHRPVAVDIFRDELDGLRAASKYPTWFRVVEAEFDNLPFPRNSADLAIFNSSFHYSTDYARTLSELKPCLRPNGSVVILDSPLYAKAEDGRRMVEERHAEFLKRYGFRSDAVMHQRFHDVQEVGNGHPVVAGEEREAADVVVAAQHRGGGDAGVAQAGGLPGRARQGPVDEVAELGQLQRLELVSRQRLHAWIPVRSLHLSVLLANRARALLGFPAGNSQRTGPMGCRLYSRNDVVNGVYR